MNAITAIYPKAALALHTGEAGEYMQEQFEKSAF